MKYDAIVIGSGQAGIPLSFRLADLGWRVALIEKATLGGTCINTGCTPTKTMVHRAQVAHYARNAARWGVNAQNVSVDLPTIVAQKNKVVLSFRGKNQRQGRPAAEHPHVQGHARISWTRIRFGYRSPARKMCCSNPRRYLSTPVAAHEFRAFPVSTAVKYLTNENIMEVTVAARALDCPWRRIHRARICTDVSPLRQPRHHNSRFRSNCSPRRPGSLR